MLITNKHYRQNLKNKKRIVIKVGSSSLVHPETGETDLLKLEQLVRVLCDLRNQGKDVVLVSSGAIGVGRRSPWFKRASEGTGSETGLCFSGTGNADDDLSEAF